MPGDVRDQRPDERGPGFDADGAYPARVYDVFLGGKDNYPVDRAAAVAAFAANPRGHLDVRHNRDFLRRAVQRLTGRDAIRQYSDIGP